jgi:Predicted membrane protein
MQCFTQQKNARTEKFFRFFNEVPTVFLVSIVMLSVLKPF